MDKLELKIRLKDKAPTLIIEMNIEQFEIFIKQLPNIENQYHSMVKTMVQNTEYREKEIKFIVAKNLLNAINSGMPKEGKQ